MKILLSTGLACLLVPSFALAQKAACIELVENTLDTNSTMRAVVTTMNYRATATYMDFVLTKFPITDNAYRLIGKTDQVFNDRRSPPPASKPWDPNQVDKATLELLSSPGDFILRFRSLTWNWSTSLRPTCERGTMYGWDNEGKTYFVIRPVSGAFVPSP